MAELIAEYREIGARAEKIAVRAGTSGLAVRPSEGRWSPAECFGHLNLSMEAFFPLWRDSLSVSVEEISATPFRTDLWGKLLVWAIEPPYRMKVKAPPAFQPPRAGDEAGEDEREDAVAAAARFLSLNAQVIDVLLSGRNHPLDAMNIASPFAASMKYSLWSSFRINAAHSRRHLWQAEQSLPAV